jgi:hypothetical protein
MGGGGLRLGGLGVRIGIGEEGDLVAGEETFEEEGGGYLVDEVLAGEAILGAGARAEFGGVQEGMGVVGGEALVEEVEGEGGVGLAERVGEGQGFEGLGAGGAIGVEGIADYQDFDLMLADETGDGFEVGAERGAVEGEERLGGEAEGVGDGQADALVADVEREDAGGYGHEVSLLRFQVPGSRFQVPVASG